MTYIDTLPEFRSGNSIPVTRATFTRERMREVLDAYAAKEREPIATTKPTIIIYKESLAQSIISDIATFGLILLCIWASQGSTFWTFVTGCIFLFFVVVRAALFTKSDQHLRFCSLAEMREWLDKQGASHDY